MQELEKRQREILAAIVRHYVSSGAPVGSKAVAEQFPEPLSPATIRHVMAELEGEGFLAQPHVSAGRVPTDKAYRFYVDRMVSSSRLHPATARYIDDSLRAEPSASEQLMARTSQVLSHVSHHVGLVLGPAREEKLLEHIKFVKLPERRILAVIVSKPDLIENKVIHLDEEFSQGDLDQTANFLNEEFHGWSLRTIRLEIFKRMEEEKVLCDRLLNNIATLFVWGALGDEETRPLFVEGTTNILDRPEFADVHKVKELLATFEEKAKLIKILSACLQSPSLGMQVFIGQENIDSEMQQCAIIMAPYRYRDRVVGVLGVIGPTRMDYDRAITTVDYVAHLCGKLLSTN